MTIQNFSDLTPDAILELVENAYQIKLTSLVRSLPSYINRVYELKSSDGAGLVVKFYRPNRWTYVAILDEHAFMFDCEETELSVITPLRLPNGSTLAQSGTLYFALFPKKAGRQLEILDGDWQRIGSLLARMHLCGQKRVAEHRITMHPLKATSDDLAFLCTAIVPDLYKTTFHQVVTSIIQVSVPLFEKLETIRIHGDCHRGNILDRLDNDLLLIDFDDMAMGPPIADIWLLLPDRIANCPSEIGDLMRGYERFRSFDKAGLLAIESLRAMRMIYFLAWCSRQRDDFQFKTNFPEWGNDTFWQREINDLRTQQSEIRDAVSNRY